MSAHDRSHLRRVRGVWPLTIAVLSCTTALSCHRAPAESATQTFESTDAAVRALTEAAKTNDVSRLNAIFGADARDLVEALDAATARQNRQVFAIAAAERSQLVDRDGGGKTLVIGREGWPFPVPLVQEGNRWRFDTAAGKEEIMARRIGRNELSAIRISRTYVVAQRIYATRGHDGRAAGAYAAVVRSDSGRENGLYWPAKRGQARSPLGDLVADAAEDGSRPAAGRPSGAPFHGYHFRILTAQGPSAPGGARDYIQNGALSGGFALVAWPAQYDVTGVMTFIVNQDGVISEKDLGPGTDHAARNMTMYEPDASWTKLR